jgi:hypothetical protein
MLIGDRETRSLLDWNVAGGGFLETEKAQLLCFSGAVISKN